MAIAEIKKFAQGSAKDLYEISASPEKLLLRFSDRISVFDYGALPDLVPDRAASLTDFSKQIFRWLSDAKIQHGYLASDSEIHQDFLVLRRACHPKFGGGEKNLKFIPLEVVFRWGVPEGSSYLKRNPQSHAGQKFDQVALEYFTKLESFDRLLDSEEARNLSGSKEIFEKLGVFSIKVATLLKKKFSECGLFLWDGKIECAWDENSSEIILIDAITPDELRLESDSLPGLPLSKELLRLWLSKTEWAAKIRIAKATEPRNWKPLVPTPPRLGTWRLNVIQGLYQNLLNQILNPSSRCLKTFFSTLPAPKVFVMGDGGREDALRYRLLKEGCEIVSETTNADCVFVSTDADLERGAVNDFQKSSVWAWGATHEASKLEWSKEFGRHFAAAAGLRIPKFFADAESLVNFDRASRPPVVKLDGLAAGKGVAVPVNWNECLVAVEEFAKRGKILLEQQLRGPECSAFFAIQSGYQGTEATFLGTARDFKRRFAGDQGPNTGGMGAYSPHPDIQDADRELFCEWALKVCKELEKTKRFYNGILYLGLLNDQESGWNLIEFNARFGDPETQALVCTWSDEDFVLRSFLGLSLSPLKKIENKKGQALCLALVRNEYPQPASADFVLPDWNPSERESHCHLFRAKSLTGRVAYLVGFGKDLFEAGDRVFQTLVESPWKKVLDWRADILP